MTSYKTRFISSMLHLFVHHCPGIARLVSIQIADIRLIFDDLAGLELTVRNFRLGEADGSVDGGPSFPHRSNPPRVLPSTACQLRQLDEKRGSSIHQNERSLSRQLYDHREQPLSGSVRLRLARPVFELSHAWQLELEVAPVETRWADGPLHT
jgi:hypothetical protein